MTVTSRRSSQSGIRVFWAVLALLTFALVTAPSSAQTETAPKQNSDQSAYEPAVVEILDAMQSGDLDQALALADKHVTDYPKSRVGHLLRADILQAMVYNPLVFTAKLKTEPSIENPSESTRGLRHQIRNRWQHRSRDQATTHQMVPASLIDMGRHKYVMVSDMQAGRLYLYRNQDGQPKFVKDYYLSVGSAGYGKEFEGDNKTPIGVYSIYQHIAGAELPDLYGKGAYPVNYPNRYDKALNRTGYGIWLHGTPSSTYARAPWASEGCFVLSNDDLLDIEKYIDVEQQTPVILADTVDWITLDELQERRKQFTKTIQKWKQDWENLDTKAYLAHYSEENFNFGKDNFGRWAKRKKQVNAGKTFVQIDMEIDSLFLYPGETNMFIVRYTQRYLSNNYAGATEKEQYWQLDESGRWRIIYES